MQLPRLAAAVTLLSVGFLSTGPRAGATSIQGLQAEARALALRVDTIDNKLQILSEQYDQAENRATVLNHLLALDTAALGTARLRVKLDGSTLRHQAVNAYVSAGANTSISVALSSSPDNIPLQQTYLQAASGDLVTAMSSLQVSEHQLSVRQSTLDEVTAEARATASMIATDRAAALNDEAEVQSALAGVNGQLQVAIAQQEAAQQAAAQAASAAAARAAAAQSPGQAPAAAGAPSPASGGSTTAAGGGGPIAGGGSVVGGSSGAAVSAARSALGVPYEWGGASTSGFDCSGLTMYAWAHAGVSLPHSAEAQYQSVEHVSMSNLQPGDLIFYASGGYVYHVTMYIGGGQAIQAENFGTNVQVTPVWPGAIGAGRP